MAAFSNILFFHSCSTRRFDWVFEIHMKKELHFLTRSFIYVDHSIRNNLKMLHFCQFALPTSR